MKRKEQRELTTQEDNDSEEEEEEGNPTEEATTFINTVCDRLTTQQHYVAMPAPMDNGERGVRDAQGPMMDSNLWMPRREVQEEMWNHQPWNYQVGDNVSPRNDAQS